MSLLHIIVVLAVVGVLMWLLNRASFIDATYKQIIFWIVLAVVVLWLLRVFGILDSISAVTV